MTQFAKRFVKGTRGMEALQSILLLAAAFVMVTALKSLGTQANGAGASGITQLFSGTAGS